jgi:pimeloyl-ACP methyl ester carboxylesterase
MFHGFGQTNDSLKAIIEVLKDDYMIYSFDLFFHGDSTIENNEKVLHKSAWLEIITAFTTEKKIGNFSLAGYSLGTKFCLVLVEAFPEKIERLILIAPDGIKINFWYSFATALSIPRTVFKSTIERPATFTFTTKFLEKVNLLDRSVVKFARTQMHTREKRSQVYHSWVGFRFLQVDIRKLAQTISEKGIKTSIFLGIHDKMITKKILSSFIKGCKGITIKELNAGHTNLIQKVAEYYQSKL